MTDFVGGGGNDAFVGTEGNDTAIGNGGDDSLLGNGGNDTLEGNDGADYLEGGNGDDTLYSGTRTGPFNAPYYGNPWTAPTLDIGAEQDILTGGDGSDTIFAGYGDTVDGGTNGSFGDALYLSLMGASAGVTADFGQASVTIGGGTITGIENINWLQGSNFDDDITMGSGNGYGAFTPVFGMGGNDRLVAGYYTGYMDGGDGNDIVDGRGSQYLQTVVGGAGNDTLYTNTNTFASAVGGDGDDTIYAHSAINGGTGNDTIYIQASYYSGVVHGDDGDDTIHAATGGSTAVFGDAGADTLLGKDGFDVLTGGAGNDTIDGGAQIYGGSNYTGDVAVYTGNIADYQVTRNSGTGVTTIVDLRPGSPDGTDTLTNVEILSFANGTYSLEAVLSGLASGVQNFVGTANADFYYGSEDGNSAIGLGSGDTFYGFGGNDLLQGDGGADSLYGGAGNDTLYSGSAPGAFNAPYYGNPWTAPNLDIGNEQDTLQGDEGDDTFFAGFGDTVDGGTNGSFGDVLYLSLMGASAGVTANFGLASVTIGGGTITGIENINWLQGSNFDDDITLGSGNGYGAFTPVFGMGGNDRLVAGYYTGYMDGGDGNDIVDGRGSQYLQTVIGGAGSDTLYTNTNTFASAQGDDGDDIIYAHGLINGGTGNDTIHIQASYYGGTVHGDDGDDIINASSWGSASVYGDAGADQMNGDAGNDTFYGGIGNDRLTGGGGTNTLYGEAGDDRFVVTAADSGTVIDGGADRDTLAVSGAFTVGGNFLGIEVVELTGGDLTLSGSQFNTGLATNTQLSGTGSITVNMQPGFSFVASSMTYLAGSSIAFTINGSLVADVIKANLNTVNTINAGDGSDQIRGGIYADTINGDGGSDKIFGFGGADLLTGGAGADQFRYVYATDSGTGANADIITDFLAGTDKLNFALLDADPIAVGRQALSFIDTAAFSATGSAQLRYGTSGADLLVQVDLNGDGSADMEIVLQGSAGQVLTSGDFFF